MEKWMKQLVSALCTTLLTVALNTGAFADFEEQEPSLPEAPAPIIEAAPEDEPVPAADQVPEENEAETPAEESGGAENEEAPAADKELGERAQTGESAAAVAAVEEADPGEKEEVSVAGEENGDDVQPGEGAAAVVAVKEAEPGEEEEVSVAGEENGDDVQPGENAAAVSAAEEADPGEKEEAAADGEACSGELRDGEYEDSSSSELPAVTDDNPAAEQESSSTGAEETGSAGSTISRAADGTYILVNHSGTENLIAEGDITILAAGVNRISSISGTGKVRIAGTGILLVDSLKGKLELLTLTDIYTNGSTAVFVRQADGSYQLVNGGVPGLLDEEYRIEGCTLVVPEGGSLLLCGTGAEPLSDGSVAYYHGTDHGYRAEDFDNVVEMTGKLTIAEKAALVIRKGAAVILQNLMSLGGTDTDDFLRRPMITTEGDGKLVVDGTIGAEGIVETGRDSTLSGSGSITTDRLTIGDPSVLEGSQVSLSAKDLYLYGDGTIRELSIHNSTVHLNSNAIKLRGLTSSGDSLLILPGASELNIAKLSGTLALRQNCVYPFGLYDSDSLCFLSGNIQGEGTISFESGLYALQAGTKLNRVTVSDTFGGIVFDYAGVLAASLSPLHIQPENVPPRIETDGVVSIPILAAHYKEGQLKYQSQLFVLEDLPDFPASQAVSPADDGSSWRMALDLSLVKQAILDYPNDAIEEVRSTVTVDLLYRDDDGTLSMEFYSLNELDRKVSADNLYLIRVIFSNAVSYVEPDSPSTMTGMRYTGSGILGDAGAGSVRFGKPGSDSEDNTADPDDSLPQEDQEKEESAPGSEETARLQIWTTKEDGAYTLHAKFGEHTLFRLDAYVDVFLDYTPGAQTAGKPLYAVFRDAEGRLHAFRASYGQLSGKLHFQTNQLGRFLILAFEFDGKEFSDAFYEALEACAEIAALN